MLTPPLQLLPSMVKPNLLSCYQKIASMQDKQQNLHDRFGFSNTTGLIHSTQIDLEQVHTHTHTLSDVPLMRPLSSS